LNLPGNKRFFLALGPSTYQNATKICKSLDMSIATFTSYSEAQQVYDASIKLLPSAWVGMERNMWNRFMNRDLKVVDLPWAEGEPNDLVANENCVITSLNLGGYNDVPCREKFNAICEKVGE
jgi:hypothetical protein